MNQSEIRIKVITASKRESVVSAKDGRLVVSVDAPKKDGRANMRARELLAEHFLVPVSAVSIVKGHQLPTKSVIIQFGK